MKSRLHFMSISLFLVAIVLLFSFPHVTKKVQKHVESLIQNCNRGLKSDADILKAELTDTHQFLDLMDNSKHGVCQNLVNLLCI